MLSKNFINSAKVLTITYFAVILMACGGGRATTSSDQAPANQPPVNAVGSATLQWQAPTTYTNGDPLITLSGHNIYIDDGSGYVRLVSLNNPGVLDYVVDNLGPGIYKFVVTAFDDLGIESSFSNEASIAISS